jgi:hypothetical protein
MNLLSWKDVMLHHRTVAGIYVKKGLPISILVNQRKGGMYNDRVKEKELIYVLNKNTQTHGFRALLAIVGKSHQIGAFEKVDKNRWLDLGKWKAEEVIQGKGDIRIRFVR